MLTLTFSPYDLTSIRFGFSPLREASASVHALRTASRRPLHLPWFKQVRPKLSSDLAPLLDLIPGGECIPDFLMPVPAISTPELDAELATLRSTPDEVVRGDLDRMTSWPSSGPLTGTALHMYENPAAGLDQLVRAIEAYWDIAVAPHWSRMRSLLDGDLLYRTRQLAEHGLAGLFDGMHPAVRWDGRNLYLHERPEALSRVLAGEGLLLIPSVFVWPGLFHRTDSPGMPIITYPVRAIATMWERGTAPDPEAMSAVIGRSRALLLAQLVAPASTLDLARRTGLSSASVSEQLSILLCAGLVTKHRVGRAVLYSRSRRAHSLLDD